MKLTQPQLDVIQNLTTKIDQYYGPRFHSTLEAQKHMRSAMSYVVEAIPNKRGEVMLSASNGRSGLRYFEPYYHCVVVVGPKGAIKYFDSEGIEKRFII